MGWISIAIENNTTNITNITNTTAVAFGGCDVGGAEILGWKGYSVSTALSNVPKPISNVDIIG